MQKVMILIAIFCLALPSYSGEEEGADLELRMLYLHQMAEALGEVCIADDGTFLGNVVFHQPEISTRETIIDCPAQYAALAEEEEAINRILGENPNLGCQTLEIPEEHENLTMSLDDILRNENQCYQAEGEDLSVSDYTEYMACSLATAAVPKPILNTFNQCTEGSYCGENFWAGMAYSVSDTLSMLGLCFMCPDEPEASTADGGSEDPNYDQEDIGDLAAERGASDLIAAQASFQDEQSVTRFTENPFRWISDITRQLVDSAADTIMKRFGCVQWEGAAYTSRCLTPKPWSCANPTEKANMICGTTGYVLGFVGQFVAMEVATAGAAGAIIGAATLRATQTFRLAVRARNLYPRSARTAIGIARGFRAAGAFGAGAVTRLSRAWRMLKVSGPIRNISRVRTRMGAGFAEFGRNNPRQYFVLATAGELASGAGRPLLAAARKFNELSEAAFNMGYTATGVARLNGVRAVESRTVAMDDLAGGRVVDEDGNALNSPEEWFNYRYQDPEQRAARRLVISEDGQVSVVSREPAEFRSAVALEDPTPPIPVGPAASTARRTPAGESPQSGGTALRNPDLDDSDSMIVVTGSRDEANEWASDQITDAVGRSARRNIPSDRQEEIVGNILNNKNGPDGETIVEYNQRRERVIDELRDGFGLSDDEAVQRFNRLVDRGVVDARNIDPNLPVPSAANADTMNTARELDQLVLRYTRENETPGQVISAIQRGSGVDGVTDLNTFFRVRGVPARDQRIISSYWDDTVRSREAMTARQVTDNLADLSRAGATTSRVNCRSLNSLGSFSGAFLQSTPCNRVVFTKKSVGDYCTCNVTRNRGTARTPGPWMLPCANVANYLTSRSQSDYTALPDKHLNRCWKVEIPEGAVCYQGGLGPTFSGFGGQAQMACLDSRTLGNITQQASDLAADGALSADELAALRALDIPPREQAATWSIVNWSPISNNPELLAITARGASCFSRSGGVASVSCDPDTLTDIRRAIDDGEFSPEDANELELYYQYLRGDVQLDRATGYPFCMRGEVRIDAHSPLDCLVPGQSTSGFPTAADTIPPGVGTGNRTVPSSTGGTTIDRRSVPLSPERRNIGGVSRPLTDDVIRENAQAFERVSNLNPQQRTARVQEVLGRRLTPSQVNCILDAHDIGTLEGRGFGTYTVADLRGKRNLLRGCGGSANTRFLGDEVRILMEQGLVGGFPPRSRIGFPRMHFGAAQGENALEEASTAAASYRNLGPGGVAPTLGRDYRLNLETAGAAFENEARQITNEFAKRANIEASLQAYLRAGDDQSVNRMIVFAQENGMDTSDLMRLLRRTAATDGRSPLGPEATATLRRVQRLQEEAAEAQAARRAEQVRADQARAAEEAEAAQAAANTPPPLGIGSPVEDFGRGQGLQLQDRAISRISRLRNIRGPIPESAVTDYRRNMKRSAQAFENQALNGTNREVLPHIALSIQNYFKAGDLDGARRMISEGIERGMTREAIFRKNLDRARRALEAGEPTRAIAEQHLRTIQRLARESSLSSGQ